VNRAFVKVTTAIALAACRATTDANTDPSVTPALPALGVALSATATGASALGDSVRLVIRNTSGATRYLSRCGTGPLILVGMFIDGAWTEGVQNFACTSPATAAPVQLASGDSLIIPWAYLSPGSYRFDAFTSASIDLAEEARTTSNSVVAR